MKFETLILLAIIALAVFVLGWWGFRHFFSDNARWERRRRRSNTPITSKQTRPSVRLLINLKKPSKKSRKDGR